MAVNHGILQILLISLAIAAAAVEAGTDNSVAESSAFITITLVNQVPEPVEPGERLELKFRVENVGSKPAEDVTVEILPRYPFLIDESEKQKRAGSLFGRQKGKDAVLVRFFLAVDKGAGTGSNIIQLRYKTAAHGWVTVGEFNVIISQRDLPISISSIITKPEMLAPGKKASIRISLQNHGSSDALNVKVRLNMTDGTPLAPYGSTNEAIIQSIPAKSASEATFSVITNPSAEGGLYVVPMAMAYSDASGRNYTITGQSFGVIVSSTPKLTAAAVSTDLLKLNEKGRATIELMNTGLGAVKFLKARIAKPEAGYYEIISQDTTYIGDMDSGDSETISYNVIFRSTGPLLLDMEYSDELNNPHKERIDAPVKVYSSGEIARLGLEKSNAKGLIMTAAIIAVGLLVFKKIRKKK